MACVYKSQLIQLNAYFMNLMLEIAKYKSALNKKT